MASSATSSPLHPKNSPQRAKFKILNRQKAKVSKGSGKNSYLQLQRTVNDRDGQDRLQLPKTRFAKTSAPNSQQPSENNDSVSSSLSREDESEFPITGIDAVKLYGDRMAGFEKSECSKHHLVYYLNTSEHRRKPNRENMRDELKRLRGLVPGEGVNYRYEIKKTLGEGAFGQVFKAYDHKEGKHVALKVLRHEDDAQEEIDALLHLKKADPDGKKHIISLFDQFKF